MRIEWSPRSEEDLREIHDFIAKDAPATATSFIDRLARSADRLPRHPEIGGIVRGGPPHRRLLFGSYRIFYRVDGEVVRIEAVRHQKRLFDPDWLTKD